VKVAIYVEGDPHGTSNQSVTRFREAFHSFLKKALDGLPQPRVIACGSRDRAHKQFCNAATNDSEAFAILLVDSEDPVQDGKTASAHLRDREKHWNTVPEHQAHLMVQCMETWFLADREALTHYYQGGFQPSALPQNPNIEKISRADVMKSLDNAARQTAKEKYLKIRDGCGILERIDPGKVAKASPFANDLFVALRERLAQ